MLHDVPAVTELAAGQNVFCRQSWRCLDSYARMNLLTWWCILYDDGLKNLQPLPQRLLNNGGFAIMNDVKGNIPKLAILQRHSFPNISGSPAHMHKFWCSRYDTVQ
jgi:hypothetical protein